MADSDIITIAAPATEPLAVPSEPENEEAEEDLLSTLCPYCNTTPPIYTCPACFARSCSVACSKKHKMYRQCSGIRDPTAFVKRSKLMTEGGVNRDFAFLTGVERGIKRPIEMAADGEGDAEVEGGDAGKVEGGKRQKDRIEHLLSQRGTVVKWAPWEGFGRAKENRTRVVRPNKRKPPHIVWTIEWTLLSEGSPENCRFLDHDVSENSGVAFAFFNPANTPDTTRNEAVKKSETEFYLVLEAPANKKHCICLDPGKPWSENLRERTMLEFPQVLVTAGTQGEGPQGWEVLPDERKIVELPVDNDEKSKGKPRKRIGKEDPASENPVLDPVVPGDDTAKEGAVKTSSGGLIEVPTVEKRKLPDDEIDMSATLEAIKKARKV
ncbi:hypothetical protein BZA05DRAFT_332926 [Tricharina praecox]|uniref:uncharacterized protein n=1 Tax=Tricharina praecox TaxID=43433 RepID=UPI00221F0C90|nr:uncharacterized protein BZA05DRAFT_332926 [Tricharina praecox]KAI5855885.1 hypothetical protein BZA05DRAFT_332926 [Tricharina praecox]